MKKLPKIEHMGIDDNTRYNLLNKLLVYLQENGYGVEFYQHEEFDDSDYGISTGSFAESIEYSSLKIYKLLIYDIKQKGEAAYSIVSNSQTNLAYIYHDGHFRNVADFRLIRLLKKHSHISGSSAWAMPAPNASVSINGLENFEEGLCNYLIFAFLINL